MVRCPYCGAESQVIETRSVDATTIRRRRECLSCKRRFTTYERLTTDDLTVIKRDGRREKYDPHKIKEGMLRALNKRPYDPARVDAAVERITRRARAFDAPVPTQQLGTWVLEELAEIDLVAYIRFASVYQQFDSLEDFLRMILTLNPHLLPKRVVKTVLESA